MQPIDVSIADRIPHRSPFLWVDRVLFESSNMIITEKDIPVDLDVFRGHYPGQPILPGVLICEAVFQTAALLIGKITEKEESSHARLPIITKISNARFKRSVRPGETLRIEVHFQEKLSSALFFKGVVRVDDKVVLRIEFVATSI